MKPFKNLNHYYKVTGDPEIQKLCPTDLILGTCGNSYNYNNKDLRVQLLKPRIVWQNLYDHNRVTARLTIDRFVFGMTTFQPYCLTAAIILVENNQWFLARQKCLLQLWLNYKDPRSS